MTSLGRTTHTLPSRKSSQDPQRPRVTTEDVSVRLRRYADTRNQKRRVNREADPESFRENDRKRYALKARKEARRMARTAQALREPVYFERLNATHRMWRKFKRTVKDYDAVLLAQGGVCSICRNPPKELGRGAGIKRLAWDHDHTCCPGAISCGKCIRGLLCTGCNLIVGKIELGCFDPAVQYLITWNESE